MDFIHPFPVDSLADVITIANIMQRIISNGGKPATT